MVFATEALPSGFPTSAILSVVVIVPLSFAAVVLKNMKETNRKNMDLGNYVSNY
jgi:hypothetical protein